MLKNLDFEEITSEASFDPLSIDSQTPFTQGYFYGEWQKNLGRTVKRFAVKFGSDVVCFLQLIRYPLLRGKSYLYAPYGPVTKEFSVELLELLKKNLTEVAKKENAVFVRLDFTPTPNEAQNELIEKTFKKAPLYTYRASNFQPRTEWILNIKKSEDELIRKMDPKMRYGIRAAKRRGIQTEIAEKDGILKYFDDFCALMEETSRRNKFGLHPKEYYRHIFENTETRKYAHLVVARLDNKILVIDFVLTFGGTAYYVFSGSRTEYRHLYPSYLAQWEAIRHAQKLGCAEYNFGGISGGTDMRASWKGLTLFKKRFGGETFIHSDFYDIVVSPFWYYLYSLRKLIKKLVS